MIDAATRRPALRARLLVLAEELDEAISAAVDAGELSHAADYWSASAAVWAAADQLREPAADT